MDHRRRIETESAAFVMVSAEIANLFLYRKILKKGRVIGYDDLLERVKLDQCRLINN